MDIGSMTFWILQHVPMFLVHTIIFLGIVAFFVSKFTPLIPDKLFLKVGGILIFCFGLLLEGATFGVDLIKPELLKAQAEIIRINDQAKVITKEVQIQYVDRVKVIKEKGNVIIKEVPVYITTQDDSDCKLHNSFIVLHDAAAQNIVPDPTARIDDSPTDFKLSTATETIVANYTTYNQVAQQLISLQEWVKKQQANNP
jgi:hypothetical protein